MDVDTIVALATPPGVGAVSLVRISGPDAHGVLRSLTAAELPEERRATLLALRDPHDHEVIDRALATVFRGPRSCTGEDMVELSCHGGWLVPRLVLDACVSAGCRVAEPGEFTRRAYLRGKLDLVQAEAVADLVEGRSRALHRAAVRQLDRGLSDRVSALRERLVRVEALLAHHVDFPEEDDAPVPLERVIREAEELCAELDAMLATAPEGELLREGALTVFAGRPNAGKSSLYNALLGEERAIVTEIPGTTRDALEAVVQLGGFPFRLVDTAGLRADAERVERLGIEVARRYVERADLVLLCVPADEGPAAADVAFLEGHGEAPVVVVETKADLPGRQAVGAGSSGAEDGGAGAVVPIGGRVAAKMRTSTRTGLGLDELRTLLPGLVFSGLVRGDAEVPVLTRRRHVRALRSARTEIGAFGAGLRSGLPAEVAATHLRSAETALEELLGVVSVDDVLDVVFREFCIAK